jgi:hypothetical protein
MVKGALAPDPSVFTLTLDCITQCKVMIWTRDCWLIRSSDLTLRERCQSASAERVPSTDPFTYRAAAQVMKRHTSMGFSRSAEHSTGNISASLNPSSSSHKCTKRRQFEW